MLVSVLHYIDNIARYSKQHTTAHVAIALYMKARWQQIRYCSEMPPPSRRPAMHHNSQSALAFLEQYSTVQLRKWAASANIPWHSIAFHSIRTTVITRLRVLFVLLWCVRYEGARNV